MGSFRQISCGSCNYPFTDFEAHNPTIKLGITIIKCPRCNTINKTGLRPLSRMNVLVIIWVWIQAAIRGAAIGAIGGLFIPNYLFKGEFTQIIVGAFIGLLISVFLRKRIVDEVEQLTMQAEDEWGNGQ